jgi:hypothetical protein
VSVGKADAGALLASDLEIHFEEFDGVGVAFNEPAPLLGRVGEGGEDALGGSGEGAFESKGAVDGGWLGHVFSFSKGDWLSFSLSVDRFVFIVK